MASSRNLVAGGGNSDFHLCSLSLAVRDSSASAAPASGPNLPPSASLQALPPVPVVVRGRRVFPVASEVIKVSRFGPSLFI
ncbi:hypothetical protein BRADI_5g22543v3 [Brachypodium distachyon]|uniref:Uncharacterized protein n=1 Tax=Brachypodium distachyon TaxID=15368 RepID=A0A2K2CIP2_BRADI|nr:hypothetical protein BRADI_5g22543v3 [Brachypodium distachyon]